MNQKPVSRQSGSIHGNHFMVPDIVVTFFILDPAEFGLVSKRHLDFLFSRKCFIPFFFFSQVRIVKAEIPGSIEVFPVVADKLRSRIILLITFHILVLHIMYVHLFFLICRSR